MYNLSNDTIKDVSLNRETAVFHAEEKISIVFSFFSKPEHELCQFPFDDIYE